MLGILEFPSFLQPPAQSLEGSTNIEFLRINLEFLKDCFARNDENLGGILNEIASSFVLLTPRNDGILEFPSAEIPQSSWGMTQNSWGMTGNLEFLKDCFASLAMTQGILNFA